EARTTKRGDDTARASHVAAEGRSGPPVIAKGGERAGRPGIHRVRADQLLDVQHVAIPGILRSGRCPEQPLSARAEGFELLELQAGKELAKSLVHELGVGDGGGAAERLLSSPDLRIARRRGQTVQLLVDRSVDAA